MAFGARPFGNRSFGDSTGEVLVSGASELTVALALLWAVRQAVADTVDLRWNVRAAVADDLALLWNTRAAVSDELALLWSTRVQVPTTLDLRWQILANVFAVGQGKKLELVWRVFENLDPVDSLGYARIGEGRRGVIMRRTQ